MGRGRRWTEAEDGLLLEMAKSGMSVQQIHNSGMFPNRTLYAITKHLQRFGADLSGQKKISLSGQIKESEIVDRERVTMRFVDAFNKICDLTECRKEDLERFRIIFSAARTYFDLYFRLEEFSEVKNRVERLEAMVAQMAEKKPQ